jgi:Flp pilus assembly protein TadG
VLLCFGIVEFGLLLFDKAVITNASREGARYGIVYRSDVINGVGYPTDAEIDSVVAQYAQDYLISLGASAPSVSITRGADELTVVVNYDYNYMVLPFGTTALRGRTVMRFE